MLLKNPGLCYSEKAACIACSANRFGTFENDGC